MLRIALSDAVVAFCNDRSNNVKAVAAFSVATLLAFATDLPVCPLARIAPSAKIPSM